MRRVEVLDREDAHPGEDRTEPTALGSPRRPGGPPILIDLLVLLLVVAAAGVVGVAVTTWWVPQARGLERSVLVATTGTAGVLVSAQVAGLVGAFDVVAVLVGCLVLALLGFAGAGRGPRRRGGGAEAGDGTPATETRDDAAGADGDEPRWVAAVGAAVLGAGAVQWATAVVPSLRGGITDIDGLHYHLTHAAQFARDGRLLPLRFVDTGHPSAYYPSNDEVLRALGLLATDSDLAGLLVNTGAALLVLMAAALAGRRWGRPWTAVITTAVLLVGPLYGARYAGWAHVDWTAIAFLGVAVAVLVTRPGHRGATVVAGVALGLAAGTKLTVGPAVALVALAAVVVAGRGHRWDTSWRLLVPAVATGGWWYVRNLVLVGTPMPGLPGFGGPPALLVPEDQAVVDYLADPAIVRAYYLPGLRFFFGWGWPLLALVVLAGLVLAVRRGGWPRTLAVVALLALAAYLVTPTTALGPEGQPVLFTANLRYAWPALLLAGWATAAGWRHAVVPAAFAAIAFVGLAEPRAWTGVGDEAALLGAVAGVVAAVIAWKAPAPRALAWTGGGLALVGVAVLLGPVRDAYEPRRYQRPEVTDIRAHAELFAAAQQVTGTTVAVSGYPLTYPFLGPGRSNVLHVPSVVRDDGARIPHDTCATYRTDLATAGVTVAAALVGGPEPDPEEVGWLTSDPAARVLAQNSRGVVVAFDAPPDPTAC